MITTLKRTVALLLAAGAWASVVAQDEIICTGAELYSKPDQGVLNGRWEIRMQAAATPGSVSSFFTYFDSSYISGMPWREIDIEVLGNAPEGFQSNVILTAGSNTYKAFHTLPQMVNTGFHTYVLDWTPDSVVWRVDGALIRKETRSTVLTRLQEKKQSYRMNLWSSTSPAWVGELDLSKLPVYQVVNWMRYSAYTPGAGPNGSNFTESWIDDFSSFNSSRWAKGDWTFEGNQAQFSKTNLVVKNGYLVLALTTPEADGVTGVIPKDPAGDAYVTTSVRDQVRGRPLRVVGSANGIRVDGVDQGSEIAVLDAHGRILTRAAASVSEIPLDTRGVLFVRAGEQSATVVR